MIKSLKRFRILLMVLSLSTVSFSLALGQQGPTSRRPRITIKDPEAFMQGYYQINAGVPVCETTHPQVRSLYNMFAAAYGEAIQKASAQVDKQRGRRNVDTQSTALANSVSGAANDNRAICDNLESALTQYLSVLQPKQR